MQPVSDLSSKSRAAKRRQGALGRVKQAAALPQLHPSVHAVRKRARTERLASVKRVAPEALRRTV